MKVKVLVISLDGSQHIEEREIPDELFNTGESGQ